MTYKNTVYALVICLILVYSQPLVAQENTRPTLTIVTGFRPTIAYPIADYLEDIGFDVEITPMGQFQFRARQLYNPDATNYHLGIGHALSIPDFGPTIYPGNNLPITDLIPLVKVPTSWAIVPICNSWQRRPELTTLPMLIH